MNIKELKARIKLAWQIVKDRDGNLERHARTELRAAGYYDGDEMNAMMAEALIDLVRTFSTQGHSGFSASFCRELFRDLAAFKPLCPLTGEDSEWICVSEMSGYEMYQNKRCGHVFKDGTGYAYDLDGVIFEEPNGSRFTGKHSRTPVFFPYSPKSVVAKVAKDATDEEVMLAAQQTLQAA